MYCITKCCQICLKSDAVLKKTEESDEDEVYIYVKIIYCFHEQDENYDVSSSFICISCLKKVREFYKLKKLYRSSQNVFERYKNLLQASVSNEKHDIKPTHMYIDLSYKSREITRNDKISYKKKNLTPKDNINMEIELSLVSFQENDIKLQCDYCKLRFDVEENLTIHFENCSKRLFINKKLENMLRNSKKNRFECVDCLRKFPYKRYLKKHLIKGCIKRTSVKSEVTVDVSKKRKKICDSNFQCDFCAIKFKTKEKLQSHNKHHTDHVSDEIKMRNSRQSMQGHQCHLCHKIYSHVYITTQKYHCDVCDVVFLTKFKLDQHRMTHFEESLFVCDVCKIGYRCQKSLSTHMKSHLMENPFECEDCKKKL